MNQLLDFINQSTEAITQTTPGSPDASRKKEQQRATLSRISSQLSLSQQNIISKSLEQVRSTSPSPSSGSTSPGSLSPELTKTSSSGSLLSFNNNNNNNNSKEKEKESSGNRLTKRFGTARYFKSLSLVSHRPRVLLLLNLLFFPILCIYIHATTNRTLLPGSKSTPKIFQVQLPNNEGHVTVDYKDNLTLGM